MTDDLLKTPSGAAPPFRSRLALAGIVGALIAISFTLWPRTKPPQFYFAVTMRAATAGFAQLYYGIGSGAKEADSFRVFIEGGNREAQYRFPLPDGRYLNLRFDPTDQAGNTITLSNLRIAKDSPTPVRAIPPAQVKPLREIETLAASETEVVLSSTAGAADPAAIVRLDSPVILKSYHEPSVRTLLRRFLISFLLSAGLALLASPFLIPKLRAGRLSARTKAAHWAHARPHRLVLITAAAAVLLSCYPIVFFGKSFLSPNNHSHTLLLYGEMPTLPGYQEALTDNAQGSDVGAAMWYTWPTSVVTSGAILKHFELPLWNRYDSGGLPLLGQGQSMFGDPLHLLALLTNGSSLAWDLKYLIAKFLFAASIGLCVLQLTKHLPAALIVALTSSFIGFFSYRYSHPAFFSICYAPLILLCWFKLIDAPPGRGCARWLGLMVLANWMMITSGTVKEAYVLLLTMNLCGCLTLLLGQAVAEKFAKLRQALIAQFLFVVIATPIWLTFLKTLQSSWTAYDAGGTFQIPPSLFIGLFDDIFYRQFNAHEEHLNPSANFLILAGVLWFGFSSQRLDRQKLSRGLILTCPLALALVFGAVPPTWITGIPFFGRIYHIDNTFSCVAIVCLLLLAGFGIRAFWSDAQTGNFKSIYLRLLAGLAVLLGLYFGTTEAAQRATRAIVQAGENVPKSPFFWGYSFLMVAALLVLPWLLRSVIRAHRLRIAQAFCLGLIFLLVHWRHGMHLVTPFDSYVMNPQQRTDLIADASPAVDLVREAAGEPSRSVGLNYNLFPGYGGAIQVEQIDSAAPLLNRYYRSLLDASGTRLYFGTSQSALIDTELERDLPLFEMLNVRYFLAGREIVPETAPSLKQIAALDLNVYESTKVWPRAFFTDRLASYSTDAEFLELLRKPEGGPLAAVPREELGKNKDLASLAAIASPPAPPRVVPAKQYVLTTNTTAFKVDAPAAGVLVLTEPYVEDDFQLRVNGQPASYFRVNSAFRGVFLPAAGVYHFSFAYWPRHLTISLWIAGFGIILLLLWLGSVFKISRREA